MVFAAASRARQNLRGRAWELLPNAFDALVLRVAKNLQVLRPIVIARSVDVMDQFFGAQEPAQCAFRDQPMLPNVAVVVGERMVWALQQHIPVLVPHHAALPSWVRAPLMRGLCDVLGAVLQPFALMSRQVTFWTSRGEFGRAQLRAGHDAAASASARSRDELCSAWHCYTTADIGA
jgi:hypothetical protein